VTDPQSIELNPRAEVLLRSLVERYITDGHPVSSRALARETGLDLSPATVRNVLADLEDLGLVRAPHTSAGRVPTERGYRVFVDYLVKVQPLVPAARARIEAVLQDARGEDAILASASDMLSQITRFAGLVTVPKRAHPSLRQLEFLRLSPGRILVILVTGDGRVQNRVITPDREYSESELTEAANYFNATYSGVELRDVRQRLLRQLEKDSAEMHRTTLNAARIASGVFDDEKGGEGLLVSGEENLFDVPELCDVAKLRRLFDAFKTRQDLLSLLDQSMKANRVQIFIGQESGYQVFEDCSVVAAPYAIEGSVVGTLGVVGPTRMPYEQVISIVDVTARLLSSALRS